MISYKEWKSDLLSKRSMHRPDGRPLYQYRLSEVEFLELEAFLRQKIADSVPNDMAYIAERPGFPALFVLYGSEWWRRRYDGHGFSWEGIMLDLGTEDNWNQGQRSECVVKGLASWGLKINQTSGFRYLGTVAVNGGLPMRLIASEQGSIGLMLGRVLRYAKSHLVARQDLQEWVESLENRLPKSYRQPVVFSLLTDITATVLELKDKAELTAQTDAIARLDHIDSRWRERFPLPIEDDHAKSLIEQLVREAASIKIERQPIALHIERSLEGRGSNSWVLRSNLDLPEFISIEQLLKIFNLDPDNLPRIAELNLITDEHQLSTSARKVAGRGAFRFERKPWGFSGSAAMEEHVLRFVSNDGRVWSGVAPLGVQLDSHLPWVFSADETAPKLLRQGGGSVSPIKALVAMPSSWRCEGSACEEIGSIDDPIRRLYQFTGTVHVTGNDISYRIRAGNAAASKEFYELFGNRWWLDFISPASVFRGRPKLYSIDEDGVRRTVAGETTIQALGNPNIFDPCGPVQFEHVMNGETKYRSRIAILPAGSDIRVQPANEKSGTITLKGWKAVRASIPVGNVEFTSQVSGDDLQLTFSVEPEARTPDRVEVDLFWDRNPTPLKARLPFPVRGVRCFNKFDQEVLSGGRMAVQQLLGVRITILQASQFNRKRIRIRTTDREIYRTYPIKHTPDLISAEIRIADYRLDIDQLLTLDDNPDSTVIVEIELDGSVAFSLEILPYEAVLNRDANSVWVVINDEFKNRYDVNQQQALAIRLEDPGNEPILLKRIEEDSPVIVSWLFEPGDLDAGSWLIFPANDPSTISFRPTLWEVTGEQASSSDFESAIGLKSQIERTAALDLLIQELASDFMHRHWIEVEQLASQTYHLPIETFDLWRRFAGSSKAMASIALRLSSLKNEFISRFGQEMPFSWEAVSFSDWRLAVLLCRQQCVNLYGEELGPSVFKSHLISRTDALSSNVGSLCFIFGIVRSEFFEDDRKQMPALRYIGESAPNALFHGPTSPLNRLRTSHLIDNEEWPDGFTGILAAARNKSHINHYLCNDRFGFQDRVINMPMLVAASVAQEDVCKWFSSPENVYLLRNCHAFDPDWFEEAFNQTIARCLAEGIFDTN